MTVVCSTCSDTHSMSLGDRTVLCTHCPTPCQSCREGGNGAFCATTPCACDCHQTARHRAHAADCLAQITAAVAELGADVAVTGVFAFVGRDHITVSIQVATEDDARRLALALALDPPTFKVGGQFERWESRDEARAITVSGGHRELHRAGPQAESP